ncbi:MAG: S24/S26 family peptidase [Eubacteriales bacterium]
MTIIGKSLNLVSQMKEINSRGEGFWLVVTGNSMAPTLKHLRDRVYITPYNGIIKKGQILLTETSEKHCLLHRVFKCDGKFVFYNGDANTNCEGPLPVCDVIGIVTELERNGKRISVNNIYYKSWSVLWQKTIKIRFLIFNIYNSIKHMTH